MNTELDEGQLSGGTLDRPRGNTRSYRRAQTQVRVLAGFGVFQPGQLVTDKSGNQYTIGPDGSTHRSGARVVSRKKAKLLVKRQAQV